MPLGLTLGESFQDLSSQVSTFNSQSKTVGFEVWTSNKVLSLTATANTPRESTSTAL